MSTEALRLALEALESCWEIGMPNACQKKEDAITAIKAILSPQNELETHWNELRASYGARQAALEAKDKPIQKPVDFEAIIEDIETISYYYHGSPSYEHCPYKIRKEAADTVRRHASYYTTPPPVAEPHKRKPLTDEQIGDEFVRFQVGGMFTPFLYAVRAIEAAHGIIDPTDLKGKHDA